MVYYYYLCIFLLFYHNNYCNKNNLFFLSFFFDPFLLLLTQYYYLTLIIIISSQKKKIEKIIVTISEPNRRIAAQPGSLLHHHLRNYQRILGLVCNVSSIVANIWLMLRAYDHWRVVGLRAVRIPAAGPRPWPPRKFRSFAVCLPCGIFASDICVRILSQTSV